MEILLFKSSACLLALLAFYKLALEPLSVHKIKRVYLIVAVIIAAIIPFITFVKYVDPTFNFGDFDPNSGMTPPYFPADLPTIIKEAPDNYLPSILWSIYGLGATLFLIRFCVNLFNINSKIRKHTKVITNRFVNVLIEKLEVPHTFFNYIFLNKTKFENQQIPKEVIIHEETHAKQKHSLDILFIELLQLIFWFNPLLYWLKKEVKLNHEFLADQAVLNHGFKTRDYQNILLSFSSNKQELALVNAINYSSIKKRFTLMKTQTSKKAVWLRSLLLLPLLAVLLFSFSQTKEVEKEITPKMKSDQNNLPAMLYKDEKEQSNVVETVKKELEKADALKINYTQDSKLLVNGIDCNKCTLNLSKAGAQGLILSTTSRDEIQSFKIKIPGIGIRSIEGGSRLDNNTKTLIEKANIGSNITVFDIKANNKSLPAFNIQLVIKHDKNYSNSPIVKKGEASPLPQPTSNAVDKNNKNYSNSPTANEVAEYNAWAKKINSETKNLTNNAKWFPPVDEKKLIKYTNIYNRMTMEQKKHSEEMPFDGLELKNIESMIPPPPPPPKTQKENKNTGFIKINGEQHFFAIMDGKTKYYNRWGIEVDKKGKKISDKQTDGSKVVTGQKITKVYKDGKIVSEFNKTWEDDDMSIPPPPPPAPKVEQSDIRAKHEAKRSEMMAKRLEKRVELKEKRAEAMKKRKERMDRIPKPPTPRSPIDHIVDMAKKDATFYYNGDEISSDKAIELVKKNKSLNISSNSNNGVSTVHLSEKGIKTKNGKLVED